MSRRFLHSVSLAAFAALALLVACSGARADQGGHLYQWAGNYGGSNVGVAYPGNPGGPFAMGMNTGAPAYSSPGYYSRWAYMGDTGGIVSPNYVYPAPLGTSNYLYGNAIVNNAVNNGGNYLYGSALNSNAYYTTEGPAYINLDVPANAKVWFDGIATTQTGASRQYISPPLATGSQYHYDVKVQWMDNGQEVTRTRRIQVQPGATVNESIGQ